MAATERPDDVVARHRDVNIRGVLLFAAGLAVASGLVALAMWGLLRGLDRSAASREAPLPPRVAASLKRTPPEPRLEPDPLAPRAKIRAEEENVLTTYGWVDKKNGIARIPIARAMEILAARGLPPAKPMAAAPQPMAGAKP